MNADYRKGEKSIDPEVYELDEQGVYVKKGAPQRNSPDQSGIPPQYDLPDLRGRRRLRRKHKRCLWNNGDNLCGPMRH